MIIKKAKKILFSLRFYSFGFYQLLSNLDAFGGLVELIIGRRNGPDIEKKKIEKWINDERHLLITRKWKVKMANHSYLKDRLGFDPDELLNEVEDLFNNGPSDDDIESPSHKRFKSYKPSPSSSTSSMREYENALSYVKGKEMWWKREWMVCFGGSLTHHNCIIGCGRNNF